MAHGNHNALTSGALFIGGGLASYLSARWLIGRFSIPSSPSARIADAAGTPLMTQPATSSLAAALSPSMDAGNRAVSRRFDSIFATYAGSLPIAYLRALSQRESRLNPASQSGPAWGLMQVVEVVRRDYNRRQGTSYARTDLLDPRINVAIATDLLRRIVESYRTNNGDVPNLREDWSNLRFVELLTFGWNAGYSEAGGVGRVARFLKEQRRTDVTIDTVHANARAAGASYHLERADKVAWCKSVASLYAREREQQAPAALV